MSKAAMLRARIEPELKQRAEAILEEIGLTPTAAVGILYRRIVAENGFPIPLRVYNETTLRAMEDARLRWNLTTITSLDDLLSEADDEDGADDEPVQEGLQARG